jgi:hypothetical protein
MFDGLAHDFGAVPRGTVQSFSFSVANKTGGPVHIASVRVGCSCVTVSATKQDLAAGEDTTVVVRLDTRRLTGPYQKSIFVLFDRPKLEEVRLNIEAHVRDDLAVAPESVAFGRVKQGSPAEASVTVVISGLADCKIQEVKSDTSFVQASVRRLSGESGGASYQLSARLRPGLPAGSWYSALTLRTDHAALPQFRIPVNVEIQAPSAAKRP